MRTILIMTLIAAFVYMAQANAAPISDLNKQMFYKVTRSEPEHRKSSPFADRVSTPEELVVEDLQLLGVVVSNSRAYALISGYVVKEGDIVAGYKVTSIDRDQVVLKRLDEVFVLSLGGGY